MLQLHEPSSLARYFTQPSIERGPPALGPDPATRLLGNFLAVVCESLKVGAITENKLSPNYRQGSTVNQQPAAHLVCLETTLKGMFLCLD